MASEANLERRVARLEVELAALRQQIAGQGTATMPVTQLAKEVQAAEETRAAAAPPPPPPRSVAVNGELGAAHGAGAGAGVRAQHVVESRESLESRLGSQIFNRIAIVLLLTGTAYFLKLAMDRQWIGPTGRVLAGLVAGAGLVLWSERFRQKGFAAFSYSLKALGSGVLYLSLWAAFQLYHLLPAPAALGLMLLVTAWNAYMAWVQNAELLAGYALAGGFATPLLLSSGGNHEGFLFGYLLAMVVATVALVRLRPWPRLLLGAFPLTVAYFTAWFAEYYDKSVLGETSIFIALFAAAFACVALGRERREPALAGGGFLPMETLLNDILLPLANAAFAALACFFVLRDSDNYALLPWLMLALAAVYLGVMRLRQTAVASAIHLSIAVVLLTVAIPLKASGQWITVSWLVEGLALLWVASRLGGKDEAEAYASRTLRGLAAGSLLLGFGGVCVHTLGLNGEMDLPLWNKGTGTALVGLAVFAGAAWLALRITRAGQTTDEAQAGSAAQATSAAQPRAGTGEWMGWSTIAMGAFVLVGLVAALLTMRELWSSWAWPDHHAPFQTGDFVTALIALAVFAGVVAASLRVAPRRAGERFWMGCAAASTVAFNLVAVLAGVREIAATWSTQSGAAPTDAMMTGDAALQQALATSGFLMAYGAALLAVGFWRRSEFLRWQALGLLVFTIFKAFLYDMRNLSQGYRVASFMGLGALLMGVSFAYQRDLLGLRVTEAKHGADGDDSVAPDVVGDPNPDAGTGAVG